MTAREWIENNFDTNDDMFLAEKKIYASIDFFVNVYGDALENALANNLSIYDELSNTDDRWQSYFEVWKEKGVIS